MPCPSGPAPRWRRRVLVRGRVQGVWFRGATAREARDRGVAGWVRNRRDGSVEALFEGSVAAVEALLAFVAVGPPAARVDDLEVHEEEPTDLLGFEVRSTA